MISPGNLIGGEWVDTAARQPDINPSDTRDLVGEFPRSGETETVRAVEAARHAFPRWSASTPQQRFDILDAAGSEILARREELGTLLAREEGKILPEAIGEVVRAGQIFKFFAGEAVRQAGEHLKSVRAGIDIDVLRQPLGVIGLITPWNFPMAIPAWKTAPALAFGNTVVLKPAELAPGCAFALADILTRAGLPPGAFNCVFGPGSAVGATLVGHPDVDAISFTGSQEVGRQIAAACGRLMKKFQLEMGGKNPLVVLDDAGLDVAVAAAINGSFYSTGQRCTASSRLIVTAGIHDRFLERMRESMAALRVGNALLPDTQIGPVVDEAQLRKNLEYVALARQEGGRLVAGGSRIEGATPGFYMAPALLADTTPAMRINREEVFGPVASVLRVGSYDEALAVANETPYGLSAGICTTSLKYASHFRDHAQAGMVMINLPTAGVDYHVPFGGRKGSSFGSREQGRYAVEFYTTVKTCYTAP